MFNTDLLLQSITDAIIMLDRDGYIVFSNPAVTTLTGYSVDEIINEPFSFLYGNQEESRTKIEYELSMALKTGRFSYEGWFTKKDQTRVWIEYTITPAYDDQKKFAGYACLVRDISARKNLEIELRQGEQLYREMVEGVRDYSIFLLNPTGHIVTWNEGAKRINGYLPEEIIGKHFSIFYTRQDLDDKKPERELKIAVETGKYEEEGWRVRKNGSIFWANVVITALFTSQNRHTGFSKVVRDLTIKKEIEESLRQSEERYRSLVEQVLDYGIFMLDEKGRIISWNEGARRIKGYSAEEIIGKHFSIFYTEEDILNNKPPNELRIARNVGKYEEEGWRVKKDGSKFWANVVITAVFNDKGILIGFSKVTRDLTEKKNAEKAVKESYDQMRLLTRQLQATNSELTYANQELEQFTSIVSHDLQEPIRTIKSFLQLIDMKLDASQEVDLKNYISKAINAANRMKELIQNLLHYSQLDKNDVISEDVNVNELIGEALQNLKSSIDTSKANITVENELDYVKGDRVQLLQLIQNLLSNAVKFTAKTNPRVTIRARKENGEAVFSIVDNGIGIAADDQSKIFEIFRRLNTKHNYPGTGIGLAICKKIVSRHRGKIWPESESGKGTTFHFTLNTEDSNIA